VGGPGAFIAARLEGLAAAGGIYVSGAVHDEVRDKLDIVVEDTLTTINRQAAAPS